MSNLNHFTEYHRFTVYRDFALSALQQKMLAHVYQPMIGPLAVSLFATLSTQLSPDQAGFSPLEQQRKLFLSLALEPNDNGRALLLEQTSRLEAVGLMQSYRKYLPASDDYVFEYRLQAPLGPTEFFENTHLTLLLRDKIGKYPLLLLRDELFAAQPKELGERNVREEALSIPFYELFRLNSQVVDLDLERLANAGVSGETGAGSVSGAGHSAPSQPADRVSTPTAAAVDEPLQYAQIVTRFPRDSVNRIFVENLRNEPQQLATVRFVAKKFRLTLQETCRLLDEDGMFDDAGELQVDRMQHVANLMFRQNKQRTEERERVFHKLDGLSESAATDDSTAPHEHPVANSYYLDVPTILQNLCDVHQYNLMLRNEPYTQVLERFFQQRAVPDPLLNLFAKLDLTYRLPEPVLNVLIHYLHVLNKSWTRGFIEAIATDLAARQVFTYEQAVDYVREKMAPRAPRPVAKESRGRKPKLVVAQHAPADTQSLTPEEMAELKKMAARLDDAKPSR